MKVSTVKWSKAELLHLPNTKVVKGFVGLVRGGTLSGAKPINDRGIGVTQDGGVAFCYLQSDTGQDCTATAIAQGTEFDTGNVGTPLGLANGVLVASTCVGPPGGGSDEPSKFFAG